MFDKKYQALIVKILSNIFEVQRGMLALMEADRRLSSAEFSGYGTYRSKATGKRVDFMADYSLANDVIATIPISFKDAAGTNVKNQTGGSATSSDDTTATVKVVQVDGADAVEITPVKDGEVTITYTHPEISDATAVVDIAEPSATVDAFDFADASTRPLSSAGAGAATGPSAGG
jgi:hypothetical protein